MKLPSLFRADETVKERAFIANALDGFDVLIWVERQAMQLADALATDPPKYSVGRCRL
jgi:hypothetical protein